MRPYWGDVNARARGLGTHLLGRTELAGLAAAGNLGALGRALVSRGLPLPPADGGPPSAEVLERAARRRAGARLALLARWLGPRRRDHARVVYEDEERRSVRALVRGAAEGAPAGARLAGLLPTAGLPEAALEDLAARESPGEVVRGLREHGHPFGEAMAESASLVAAEVFELEVALERAFAGRALEAAGADRHLRAFVGLLVDLANGWTALLAGGPPRPLAPATFSPEAAFLEGGRLLSREEFRRAAATDPREAAAILERAVAGSALAGVFAGPEEAAAREDRALRALIGVEVAAARTDPSGPAPFLAFVLRLRAELVDLRRIVWGTALGAPAELVAAELVTPA